MLHIPQHEVYWSCGLLLPVHPLEIIVLFKSRIALRSKAKPLLIFLHQNLLDEINETKHLLIFLVGRAQVNLDLIVEDFLPDHAFAVVKER